MLEDEEEEEEKTRRELGPELTQIKKNLFRKVLLRISITLYEIGIPISIIL